MLNVEQFYKKMGMDFDGDGHILLDDKIHVWVNPNKMTVMQTDRNQGHEDWLINLSEMSHAVAMKSRSGYLSAQLMYLGEDDETDEAVKDCLRVVKLC